ncbi:hypothetical protein GJ496_005161 [Pomphorhynchus laevis]|nr:hypothetical protein GJ496_005161 [Pomphorhynchus laevis]
MYIINRNEGSVKKHIKKKEYKTCVFNNKDTRSYYYNSRRFSEIAHTMDSIFDKIQGLLTNTEFNSLIGIEKQWQMYRNAGLSTIEIKFLANYVSNKINQSTLYIKNLHRSVTEETFARMFIIFQEDDNNPLRFRLCNGKMRRQGFVKFPDKCIACRALHTINGFILHNKSVVVEFSIRLLHNENSKNA